MSKAADSNGSLTLADLETFFNSAESAAPKRMQLIAPSLKIAKQWAKEYPGYDILISSKNLPTRSTAPPKSKIEKKEL